MRTNHRVSRNAAVICHGTMICHGVWSKYSARMQLPMLIKVGKGQTLLIAPVRQSVVHAPCHWLPVGAISELLALRRDERAAPRGFDPGPREGSDRNNLGCVSGHRTSHKGRPGANHSNLMCANVQARRVDAISPPVPAQTVWLFQGGSHVIFLRSSSVNSFRTVSPLLR